MSDDYHKVEDQGQDTYDYDGGDESEDDPSEWYPIDGV